jgi:prephenate dehydrogenase
VRTVAIVGVGLIGGSFALALRRAGFQGKILGVSSAATLVRARERNVIDEGLSLEQAIPRADLVYLAQPIDVILRTISKLPNLIRDDALVTDAGSTKREIVGAARKTIPGKFLGGHPLAGKETRGVDEADASLFEGRTYVLTPDNVEDFNTSRYREFVSWVTKIGAQALVLSAEEHDRVVAFTSHLPQLASTALAVTLSSQLGRDDQYRVSGPGLADQTRLARSSFDVWGPIIASNRNAIDTALHLYIEELQAIRARLGSAALGEKFDVAGVVSKKIRQHPKDPL